MPDSTFLGDILTRMARAGRLRRARSGDRPAADLCDELIGDRGEASGLATAMLLLDAYEEMDRDARLAFFRDLAARFGADEDALDAAIKAWTPGDTDTARALHLAAEPASQELIRRLNRVPGATARLVRMRADLLGLRRDAPELRGLDSDFQHLFASWFNRGFLEIRRIDWSTPAAVLEKIIAYEAVHEITGWDDLRQRVAAPDRKLFAFFHPAMPTDPLIFVEVALTAEIPGAIGPILAKDRKPLDPTEATTAVFYSISNCQEGLRGISFGNFLIKQVVTELARDLPGLKTFVTLSPAPGLRKWVVGSKNDAILPPDLAAALDAGNPDPEGLRRVAAHYLLKARRPGGTAHDPVAHFHLGNGAILHRVHADADTSDRGLANSWGAMVNYLYDGARIEENHQAYATEARIAASPEVRVLAGLPKR
jgi:malonyl-CoA decarboxylase